VAEGAEEGGRGVAVVEGEGEGEELVEDPFPCPVTSLALTAHEESLWVGLRNGEVRIFVGAW
jgi:hypothetical protein